MSLYVNGWEFNGGTFNSNEIMSVYYNNVLVWERVWIGWERATWEDIYNLCKDKQSGKITEWPEDIVLGARKTVYFSSYLNYEDVAYAGTAVGITQCEVEIIGIDIDGNGILTFDTVNCLRHGQAAGADYKGSYLEEICQRFYNLCNIQSYIKPLVKGTAVYASGILPSRTNPDITPGVVEPTFAEEKVWPLSEFEVGLVYPSFEMEEYRFVNNSASAFATAKEATLNVTVPYPYFNDNTRKKYFVDGSTSISDWYLRSLYYSELYPDGNNSLSPSLCCCDRNITSYTFRDESTKYGFVAAFAIG